MRRKTMMRVMKSNSQVPLYLRVMILVLCVLFVIGLLIMVYGGHK